MKGPLFYAKILLFGEYGVTKDSKGLAIPYNSYKGALKKTKVLNGVALKSNINLNKYYRYLSNICKKDSSLIKLRLDDLRKDIKEGLYFDSSIPQGYGVGSSGALVASVYDKYASDKITVLENLTRDKLLRLKKIFSNMESFFHIKSSGIDPLNSYLSIPLLINSKYNQIEPTGLPYQNQGKGAVFLVDSKQEGDTAPMFGIFMNKMKQEGFSKMINEEFTTYTDACIDDFLYGNMNSLFRNVKNLSKVVLKHFQPMIPSNLHHLWKKGIDTNTYYLKLCGSGGGGYMLGFAEDYEKAKEELQGFQLETVYRF